MADYMRVIDTDPELLRTSAAARAHATDETWIHIQGEVKAADGDLDALMTTLRSEEPYGYTIQPEINGDGTVRAPIITTREEIVEAYKVVRGRSDLLVTESLIELRRALVRVQRDLLGGPRAGDRRGLRGHPPPRPVPRELRRGHHRRARLAAGARGDPRARRDPRGHAHHRHGEAAGADRAARPLPRRLPRGRRRRPRGDPQRRRAGWRARLRRRHRRVTELRGRDQAREHYRALFERFEILSVQLLDRVVQEWYTFAETRATARPRSGGADVAFHTVEFSVPAKDGLFMVRVGHGTDLVELG